MGDEWDGFVPVDPAVPGGPRRKLSEAERDALALREFEAEAARAPSELTEEQRAQFEEYMRSTSVEDELEAERQQVRDLVRDDEEEGGDGDDAAAR